MCQCTHNTQATLQSTMDGSVANVPMHSQHAGYIAKHYGWQWGMWAPGAAALAVGFFALGAARFVI